MGVGLYIEIICIEFTVKISVSGCTRILLLTVPRYIINKLLSESASLMNCLPFPRNENMFPGNGNAFIGNKCHKRT